MDLIIQLIAGVVGGNAGGAFFKNLSLGPLGNSIAGAVGGGLVGTVLNAILGSAGSVAGAAASGGASLGDIASGGVGGIVLMLVVAVLKGLVAQK